MANALSLFAFARECSMMWGVIRIQLTLMGCRMKYGCVGINLRALVKNPLQGY